MVRWAVGPCRRRASPFVLWGTYQGLALVAGRAVAFWTARNRVIAGLVMFHVTCYGWLIFRAESFDQIARFTTLLARNLVPGPNTAESLLVPFLLAVAPLLAVHIYQARKGSESAVLDLRWPVRYALYGAVAYLVLLFGDFEGAQFIYFQF
jgi:alginate O-acetyltransferase complex protein AlgI